MPYMSTIVNIPFIAQGILILFGGPAITVPSGPICRLSKLGEGRESASSAAAAARAAVKAHSSFATHLNCVNDYMFTRPEGTLIWVQYS